MIQVFVSRAAGIPSCLRLLIINKEIIIFLACDNLSSNFVSLFFFFEGNSIRYFVFNWDELAGWFVRSSWKRSSFFEIILFQANRPSVKNLFTPGVLLSSLLSSEFTRHYCQRQTDRQSERAQLTCKCDFFHNFVAQPSRKRDSPID